MTAILQPFNAVWFAMVAVVVLAAVAFGLLLKRHDREWRRHALFWLAVFALVYFVVYKWVLYLDPAYNEPPLGELPLHLCNISVVLALFATGLDNRTLQAFCLCCGGLAALMGLVTPVEGFADVSIFLPRMIGYYGFHGLACILGFSMLAIYRPRWRDLGWLMVFCVVLMAAVHVVNVVMRATVFPGANYFFTFGLPGNPVLGPLYALIPVPLVYELPLLAVVAAVFAMFTVACGVGKNESIDRIN